MEHTINSPKSNKPWEVSNANGALAEKTTDLWNLNEEHKEGKATKEIENQTSKIPSGAFLAFAVASMAISAGLALSSRRKDLANFVGLWAPSFLILGLYNKIVKTLGSDSQSPRNAER